MSEVKNINAKTLNAWLEEDQVLLIDVREPDECSVAKIINSINIPLSKLCLEDVTLPEHKNKKIVIQCRSGVRSMSACLQLLDLDPTLELYNFGGGILEWSAEGYLV